jgi:hypothetical protein
VPEGDKPLSEAIDQALLRLLQPDLLEQSRQEKERHRNEQAEINRLQRVANWGGASPAA